MSGGSRWRVPDRLKLPHMPPLVDRSLPHQLRLTVTSSRDLALGCNCISDPIEVRSCWAASTQLRVYADWHKEQGIEV